MSNRRGENCSSGQWALESEEHWRERPNREVKKEYDKLIKQLDAWSDKHLASELEELKAKVPEFDAMAKRDGDFLEAIKMSFWREALDKLRPEYKVASQDKIDFEDWRGHAYFQMLAELMQPRIATRHPDDHGSRQENLWGVNLYPRESKNRWVEFDSMINIRPSKGNRSRGVESLELQDRIRKVIEHRIEP